MVAGVVLVMTVESGCAIMVVKRCVTIQWWRDGEMVVVGAIAVVVSDGGQGSDGTKDRAVWR